MLPLSFSRTGISGRLLMAGGHAPGPVLRTRFPLPGVKPSPLFPFPLLPLSKSKHKNTSSYVTPMAFASQNKAMNVTSRKKHDFPLPERRANRRHVKTSHPKGTHTTAPRFIAFYPTTSAMTSSSVVKAPCVTIDRRQSCERNMEGGGVGGARRGNRHRRSALMSYTGT